MPTLGLLDGIPLSRQLVTVSR